MLRRFIVFSSDHRLKDARCQRARGREDKGHSRIEIVPAGGIGAAAK
jgi:hypothetical protein